MKGYIEDARSVQEAAAEAAGECTARDRLTALTRAFALCGELAGRYHDPRIVAGMLVHRTAETYGATLRARREAVVAA